MSRRLSWYFATAKIGIHRQPVPGTSFCRFSHDSSPSHQLDLGNLGAGFPKIRRGTAETLGFHIGCPILAIRKNKTHVRYVCSSITGQIPNSPVASASTLPRKAIAVWISAVAC